jgi:tetratricopeptide (TPR) repeat protein
VPSLPPGVFEEHLGDIKEAAFINFLRRDDTVDRRYRTGELPLSLLQDLYKKFGGTPRFLLQMREALRQMGLDELKSELEKVELLLDAEAGRLQELRNGYFETIITSRLYEYLQPEARKALSRAAVYGIAINMDGLVAVCGENRDNLFRFIKSWQERAFVYPDIDTAGSERWVVYGLIRSWLMDKLSSDELKQAHKDAGDFLWELEKKDQGQSLGLNWIAILQEARAQYLQAGEYEKAREATDRLSEFFQRSGLYEGLRQINLEMMNFDLNPTSMYWIGRSYDDQGDYDTARKWYQRELDASADKLGDAALAHHSLATIDLEQGNYQSAHETFMKSLQIRQEIGDRTGEATTLNNLATIDLEQGNYQAAHETFMKALQIKQEIGDRLGEAATWHNLATIDLEQGNYQSAHEKSMKALQIKQEIGNRAGEATTLNNLASIDLKQGNYQAAYF